MAKAPSYRALSYLRKTSPLASMFAFVVTVKFFPL